MLATPFSSMLAGMTIKDSKVALTGNIAKVIHKCMRVFHCPAALFVLVRGNTNGECGRGGRMTIDALDPTRTVSLTAQFSCSGKLTPWVSFPSATVTLLDLAFGLPGSVRMVVLLPRLTSGVPEETPLPSGPLCETSPSSCSTSSLDMDRGLWVK